MTRYELAGDKRITVAAIIAEVAMVVVCVLLGDAIIEYIHNLPPQMPVAKFFAPIQSPIASHAPLMVCIIVFLVLQYIIAALEMIVRFRDDQRGFTLPIVFIPGGILIRTILMAVLELLVIVFKLLIYFVSVLLSFIFQILHISKILGTGHIVDAADQTLEPIEILVNKLYNLLYFHKIHANSSVFTSVFNCSLSFWSINH